jgi:parallel beta-helix repeat protein
MSNLITDFGAIGNGVADDTTALRNALASGQPIEAPEAVYKITGAISLPAGTEIVGRGRPTFRFLGAFSAPCFATAGDGVMMRDINIDADKASKGFSSNWALSLAHSNAVFDNVNIVNSKVRGILLTGAKNRIIGGSVTATAGPAIQIRGGWGNILADIDLSGNTGFGVHLDEGAHDNKLDGLQCYGNGLELVGLTYTCYRNRITSCHAEGTGDNGFSLTGFENTLMGCVALRCRHSGIYLYGSRNTISNNLSRDNGQRFLIDGTKWAGMMMVPGWGGLASDNTVVGNIFIDTQTTKTQAYGVRIGKHAYTTWTANKAISLNAYIAFGSNVYKAMTAAGTTGTTPPTHTSGAISDGGVTWTWIDGTTTNLDAAGNVVAGNVVKGNWQQDISVQSTNVQCVESFDWAGTRPLWVKSTGNVDALGQVA